MLDGIIFLQKQNINLVRMLTTVRPRSAQKRKRTLGVNGVGNLGLSRVLLYASNSFKTLSILIYVPIRRRPSLSID